MQGDLFEVPSQSLSSHSIQKFAFLEQTRVSLRLDQIMVGIIALVILYVLVFSIGVEKGKRFALAELAAERQMRERIVSDLTQKILKAREVQQPPASVSASPSIPKAVLAPPRVTILEDNVGLNGRMDTMAAELSKVSGKRYTIQVVTYTSHKQAEEQILKLGQKGYGGFVIPSGRYLQVCVDTFDSREKAAKVLRELKSSGLAPPDAYVRLTPTTPI
ncbi:MAG: SPOR domain-containing protein [Candidatus Omnitrophica bacterium]|nr:SPOR domain-containing protein [Candidatus Omnitrophota bacterium]